MTRLPAVFLCLALCGADSPVHWPVTPAPAPTPAPTPSPITAVSQDELYVIGLDQPAVVVASPPGIVTVTTEAGPVKIRAKFVGDSKVTTKTFSTKQVVTVEPTGTGQVELIITWGDPTSANVERRLIQVGAPAPPPAPPAPADPLVATLQTAYAGETDTTKAAEVNQLAALFRVAGTSTVNDASITSTADLLSKLKAASAAVLPAAAIPKVRAAVGAELNKTLATPATLDAAKRTEVSAAFTRIATALEALK